MGFLGDGDGGGNNRCNDHGFRFFLSHRVNMKNQVVCRDQVIDDKAYYTVFSRLVGVLKYWISQSDCVSVFGAEIVVKKKLALLVVSVFVQVN